MKTMCALVVIALAMKLANGGRMDVASQQAVMEKVREREAASQFVSQS